MCLHLAEDAALFRPTCCRESLSGKPQAAKLDRETESVVRTATLANDRHIGFAKRVVQGDVLFRRRECRQVGLLGRREEFAAWHRCPF